MKKMYTPKSKRVIFFDLNNTLIDQPKTFEHHFIQNVSDLMGRWNADEHGLNPKKIWIQYEQERKKLRAKSKQKMSRTQTRNVSLKKALTPLPIDVDDSFIRSFFSQLERNMRSEPILFDQTERILHYLSQKYKLAIISNGGGTELFSSKFEDIFPEKHIFTAKKCGFRKPHSSIFQHAVKSMGVQPKQAVMIGNSWKKDIHGANQYGLDSIWVNAKSKKKRTIMKRGKHKIIVIRKISQLINLF